LGLGYAASEWPVAFVTRGLAEALAELPARAAPGRPPAFTNVRLEATDHDRTWMITTDAHGRAVVEREPPADASADATVTGWGCDLLVWLYGRDVGGAGLAASGDAAALDLPTWFPYP